MAALAGAPIRKVLIFSDKGRNSSQIVRSRRLFQLLTTLHNRQRASSCPIQRDKIMNRTITVALIALSLGTVLPSVASAQTAKDLVGSWSMLSNETTRPDGTKVATWGANPKGNLILESNGRFSIVVTRADLPKFSSNNRLQGTPDENKTVVHGSIAYFGTYLVTDKVITLKVEASTFPNWTGSEQKRPLTITGDEMKWTVAAGSGGGTVELVWKRIK
jgi:lipocalin-like protein